MIERYETVGADSISAYMNPKYKINQNHVGADSISALNLDSKNIHISKRVDMESTPTQYKYRCKSLRLKHYDYSRAGYYFITILAQNREHLFGANAGDVNYRKGKFYCTNVCGVLINKNGYANQFMAEILNTVTKKHVSYVGNPKLMNGVMAKISIPIPSLDEQKKIADCLSSLDNLIEAQNKKVEALKEHKKGLMQQLFVSEEG